MDTTWVAAGRPLEPGEHRGAGWGPQAQHIEGLLLPFLRAEPRVSGALQGRETEAGVSRGQRGPVSSGVRTQLKATDPQKLNWPRTS